MRLTVLAGVLIMALLAAGLTEATVALGPHGSLSNDAALRSSPKPKATFTPTGTATPALTPTATPVATPVAATATTNGFVHLRASNSTSSAILTDLNAGTVVELLPFSDSLWQQVSYNGTVGYLWKAYLAY